MPDGQVLEFTNVTKHFNEVTAVSDLSARVEPGAVTAFLGPNGAGKTTTLRILLGQIRASSGTATIGGTTFGELRQPLRTIGSVLEETVYRTRRTATRQLSIAAKANGIPLSRVGEVLAEVGLEGDADSRIGGFSLGMRQRLSVAHALLGDPGALVFDEPANGLDPEGIRWMRLLMRRLADEGRTVLVSSHVLSEVEQVADNVLVLSKGQLVLSSGIETLADPTAGSVVVDAADRSALTAALSAAGFDVEVLRSGLTVRSGGASTVGAVAAAAGIALSTLVQRGPTLEDVFIDLVRGGKLGARASAAASQLTPMSTGLPLAAAPATAEADASDASAADAPSDDAPADDAPATDEPADEVSDEALIAETTSVSAAVSDAAPADPITTAALAAGAEDEGASHPTDERTDTDSHADASADAAPSFDEILFGTATPGPADASSGPEHDITRIFGDERNDSDASGVEVFEDLDTEDGHSILGSDSDADSDADADADADAADADPRSAAVSSMLAAAARAYYEDEPRDYPVSEQGDESGSAFAVASTGVIDTVPQASEGDASEGSQGEHQHHEQEHHEHHEGDQHHEQEHHEGQHHEHQHQDHSAERQHHTNG